MLLPSPTTSDANGAGAHGDGGADLRTTVAHDLMPTPRAGDGEKGGPNQRGSSGDLMLPSAVALLPTPDSSTDKYRLGGDSQQSHSLPAMAIRGELDLLPTPTAASDGNTPESHLARKPGRTLVTNLEVMAPGDLLPTPRAEEPNRTSENYGDCLADAVGITGKRDRWGKYAAAIARWERITRPAPEPTNITAGYLKARLKRLARLDKRPVGMRGSLKVRRQLAARFSEWMMGVPLGWITDVPGITRNEALKAAGNGVVPQQAAEALRFLLDMPTGRQIADAHEPDDLFELLAVSAP